MKVSLVKSSLVAAVLASLTAFFPVVNALEVQPVLAGVSAVSSVAAAATIGCHAFEVAAFTGSMFGSLFLPFGAVLVSVVTLAVSAIVPAAGLMV
ncbi:MAG: hypothetical protein LBP36_01095 [Oscillospiraceae bacterium]|jgi:hypothetical protein|nr:hypothetical protein [Oscillospiraceae bacterium]